MSVKPDKKTNTPEVRKVVSSGGGCGSVSLEVRFSGVRFDSSAAIADQSTYLIKREASGELIEAPKEIHLIFLKLRIYYL